MGTTKKADPKKAATKKPAVKKTDTKKSRPVHEDLMEGISPGARRK